MVESEAIQSIVSHAAIQAAMQLSRQPQHCKGAKRQIQGPYQVQIQPA